MLKIHKGTIVLASKGVVLVAIKDSVCGNDSTKVLKDSKWIIEKQGFMWVIKISKKHSIIPLIIHGMRLDWDTLEDSRFRLAYKNEIYKV